MNIFRVRFISVLQLVMPSAPSYFIKFPFYKGNLLSASVDTYI